MNDREDEVSLFNHERKARKIPTPYQSLRAGYDVVVAERDALRAKLRVAVEAMHRSRERAYLGRQRCYGHECHGKKECGSVYDRLTQALDTIGPLPEDKT